PHTAANCWSPGPRSCASRRAIASPHSRTGSGGWERPSTSCPTASTCTDVTGSAVARCMPATIIVWRWPLRSLPSGQPGRRRSRTRARRRCRIRRSSRCSSRFAAEVNTDKIYLVGFMGAGKTTIARALGRVIGWRVEDLDERIETRERRSIAGIFSQQREPYFQQLERQMLTELLSERHIIVATGGGTFAEADNRAVMLADGTVAWLDLPLARVIDRVQLEQLYARRQLAYAHAHLRVDATGPVPEVVERVLAWIEY